MSTFGGYFKSSGRELTSGPQWGMSMKDEGSMRFRWNETNPVRIQFIEKLCGDDHKVSQIELVHSKDVYAAESEKDTLGKTGDGIITVNKSLVPVVTVADCVPIFLYDPVTGVFGTLHSGWKGTGIALNALKLAEEKYGAKAQDFCAVVGPHIQQCCYQIENDRAEYFRKNFGPDTVALDSQGKIMLSLTRANFNLLVNAGVREENIILCPECTCCDLRFGSFRRETSLLPAEMSDQEKMLNFTVQIAYTLHKY